MSGKRRHGGSVFFADPRFDAVEAGVFWHPESFAGILTALTSREQRRFENSWISIQELACEKTILVMPDGTEHLLLRDRRRVLQVLCLGDSIAIEPCAIGLLANDLPNVRPKTNLMFAFADLYRERKPGQAIAGWSARSKSLRDALVALDGSLNGASYREIAAVIYGPKTVSEDWQGGHGYLKNRIVRAVERGRRLMNGGYRELLS